MKINTIKTTAFLVGVQRLFSLKCRKNKKLE